LGLAALSRESSLPFLILPHKFMKEKLSREFAKAFPVYRQPNSPSSFQKKAKKNDNVDNIGKTSM